MGEAASGREVGRATLAPVGVRQGEGEGGGKDARYLDFLMDSYQLPEQDTTYTCRVSGRGREGKGGREGGRKGGRQAEMEGGCAGASSCGESNSPMKAV